MSTSGLGIRLETSSYPTLNCGKEEMQAEAKPRCPTPVCQAHPVNWMGSRLIPRLRHPMARH